MSESCSVSELDRGWYLLYDRVRLELGEKSMPSGGLLGAREGKGDESRDSLSV